MDDFIECSVARAIERSDWNKKALAAKYGWHEQSFRNALNPDQPGAYLNVRHLVGVYLSTRDRGILDAVGDEFGCLMLPLDMVDGVSSDQAVLDNALALFDGTGRMIHEVRDSVADGVVSDDEWQELRAAANELKRALAAVMDRCDSLRGK